MFIVAFIHAECTIQEQIQKKGRTANPFLEENFLLFRAIPFMAVKAEAEAAQAKFVRETRAASCTIAPLGFTLIVLS